MADNNIVPFAKKLTIQNIVFELGFQVGHHPNTFSDCFDFKGVDVERVKEFTKTISGLSRVVNGLLPPKINDRFSSIDDFLFEIINDEKDKFVKCKAMKEFSEIVNIGIKQAIAFLIVKNHPEIENIPDLMEIRRVIVATQNTMATAARGASRGPRGQEVMDAIEENLSSRGVIILTEERFRAIIEIVTDDALLHGNIKALNVLKDIYAENKHNLFPILNHAAPANTGLLTAS